MAWPRRLAVLYSRRLHTGTWNLTDIEVVDVLAFLGADCGVSRLLSCLALSWPGLLTAWGGRAGSVSSLLVVFLNPPLALLHGFAQACRRITRCMIDCTVTAAHHHPGRIRQRSCQPANQTSHFPPKRSTPQNPTCQDELIVSQARLSMIKSELAIGCSPPTIHFSTPLPE